MSKDNKTTNTPTIHIEGGDKNYQVCLLVLSEFLDTCKNKLDVTSLFDIETSIQKITDLVVEGIADDRSARQLKSSLKFLRELDLLFKGLLYEKEN